MAEEGTNNTVSNGKVEVVYKFCDLQRSLVTSWKDIFSEYIPDRIQVSPANSYGFMDGGIDMAYSRHFGWQLQDRLQKIIREDYHGELLVGQAIILPTEDSNNWVKKDMSAFNEGKPIKYLVSAPTMRVPWDVAETPNAYLAFRAVLLAVQKFNADPSNEPIRSVLVPGLGTAVGRMPCHRCAYQMFHAFEIVEMGLHQELVNPRELWTMMSDQVHMVEFGNDAKTARKVKSKKESSGNLPAKSISELKKSLENLAPPTTASNVQESSTAQSIEDSQAEKEDEIPDVYDPKDIV